MKIIEKLFKSELSDIYPPQEIRNIFNLCLKHLGFTDADILLKEKKLCCENLYFIESTLIRLKKNEPIQYILGYTDFRDLTYHLNADTLIPRPETEELVELILEQVNGEKHILDIGTGSGCIPISLKSESPIFTLSAIDISNNAIQMATQNAIANKVDVQFYNDDILNPINSYESFDVIVSNPPYVLDSEKDLMRANVLDYEPERALFVPDNDPLKFYRAICEFASNNLKSNGKLFFEINEQYGEETKNLLKEFGYSKIKIHEDLNGKIRFSSAMKI
jgi:release factor glutamine methyltransferase